jgi:hypothetical protein
MNKQLSTLLQKEMTRKEFLATIGMGVGTLLGFGSIIKFLTGQQHNGGQRIPVASGYGGGVYGGHKL